MFQGRPGGVGSIGADACRESNLKGDMRPTAEEGGPPVLDVNATQVWLEILPQYMEGRR